MALLIGEFEQTIDSKHRLALSAAFRDQIDPETDGMDFVLALGPDRHLWVYPDKYYARLMATLKPSPLPDRNARKIDLLFAFARIVKSDAQGRVVLPEKSMQRARISERVTLVGNFDHIEIWPSDEWDQHVEEAFPTYGEALYEANEKARAEGSAP